MGPADLRFTLFSKYSDEELSKLFALVERDLLNLRLHEQQHSESAPPIAIQFINYRSIQTIQADIANARP
jgi:hypothetical protein